MLDVGNGYSIRSAENDDEDLEGLRIIGNGLYDYGMDELAKCKTRDDLSNKFYLRCGKRPGETSLATKDGKIIGVTRITPDPEKNRDPKTGSVKQWSITAILPEHRGQGISTPLREFALANTSADSIFSRVDRDNHKSWSIAEKLGYQLDSDDGKERIYRLAVPKMRKTAAAEYIEAIQHPAAGLVKAAITQKKVARWMKLATPRAVIIKGNPNTVSNNSAADNLYSGLEGKLRELGYDVSTDPGEPHTEPQAADLWVGHSRGADRLRFAPEGTRTLRVDDYQSWQPGDEGEIPGAAHYELTPELMEALTKTAFDTADSASTAMSRSNTSAPAAYLVNQGLLPGKRVLHAGAGRENNPDRLVLDDLAGEAVHYDPNHGPDERESIGKGDFDTVFSPYVLNVLPPKERAAAIQDILSSMKPEGEGYIAVRSKKDVGDDKEGWEKHEDGYIVPGRGSFQRGFSAEELQELLGESFGDVGPVVGGTGQHSTMLRVARPRRVAGNTAPNNNALLKAAGSAGAEGKRVPGKQTRDATYTHASYATAPAGRTVPEGARGFNIVKTTKDGKTKLIYSPDFDTADEPMVEWSYDPETGKKRKVNQLYHHKWEMVGDDYKGFDVDASKKRSELIKKHIKPEELSIMGRPEKWAEITKRFTKTAAMRLRYPYSAPFNIRRMRDTLHTPESAGLRKAVTRNIQEGLKDINQLPSAKVDNPYAAPRTADSMYYRRKVREGEEPTEHMADYYHNAAVGNLSTAHSRAAAARRLRRNIGVSMLGDGAALLGAGFGGTELYKNAPYLIDKGKDAMKSYWKKLGSDTKRFTKTAGDSTMTNMLPNYIRDMIKAADFDRPRTLDIDKDAARAAPETGNETEDEMIIKQGVHKMDYEEPPMRREKALRNKNPHTFSTENKPTKADKQGKAIEVLSIAESKARGGRLGEKLQKKMAAGTWDNIKKFISDHPAVTGAGVGTLAANAGMALGEEEVSMSDRVINSLIGAGGGAWAGNTIKNIVDPQKTMEMWNPETGQWEPYDGDPGAPPVMLPPDDTPQKRQEFWGPTPETGDPLMDDYNIAGSGGSKKMAAIRPGMMRRAWSALKAKPVASAATGLALTGLGAHGINLGRQMFDPEYKKELSRAATEVLTDTMTEKFIPEDASENVRDAISNAPGQIAGEVAAGAGRAVTDAGKKLFNWAGDNPWEAAGIAGTAVGVPLAARALYNSYSDEDVIDERMRKARKRLQLAYLANRYRRKTAAVKLKPGRFSRALSGIKNWGKDATQPSAWRNRALLGSGLLVGGSGLYNTMNAAEKVTGTRDLTEAAEAVGKIDPAEFMQKSMTDALSKRFSDFKLSDEMHGLIDQAMRYPIDHPGKFMLGTAGALGGTYLARKAFDKLTRSDRDDERDKSESTLYKTAAPRWLSRLGHGVNRVGAGSAVAGLSGLGLADIGSATGALDPHASTRFMAWLAGKVGGQTGDYAGIPKLVTQHSKNVKSRMDTSAREAGQKTHDKINDVVDDAGNWLSDNKWPLAAATGTAAAAPYLMRSLLSGDDEDEELIKRMDRQRRKLASADYVIDRIAKRKHGRSIKLAFATAQVSYGKAIADKLLQGVA